MTNMVRMTACALVIVLTLAMAATPARAKDDALADVLVDGFYGGLIGAMLGTAVMMMTDNRDEHLSYITTGAALGVIGGTAYGLYSMSRYAALTIDGGRVAWRVPTIETTVHQAPGEPADVRVSAALVRVRFE
ncbi:MAG: hypothetical protein ACOYXR_10835 [Nitrospirota bacterium]